MTKNKRKHPGRPSLNLGIKEKSERSRLTARECRFRKKVRYQYLEDLVSNRERRVFRLQREIQSFKKICKDLDSGIISESLRDLLAGENQPHSPDLPQYDISDKGCQALVREDLQTTHSDAYHLPSNSASDSVSSEMMFDISFASENIKTMHSDACQLPQNSSNNSVSSEKKFDISFVSEDIKTMHTDACQLPQNSANNSVSSKKKFDISFASENIKTMHSDACQLPQNSEKDSVSSEKKFDITAASASEKHLLETLLSELHKKIDMKLEMKEEKNNRLNLTKPNDLETDEISESSSTPESQNSFDLTEENLSHLFETLSQNLHSEEQSEMDHSDSSMILNEADDKTITGTHIQDYVDFLIHLVGLNSSTIVDKTFSEKYRDTLNNRKHGKIPPKTENGQCKTNENGVRNIESSLHQNSTDSEIPDGHNVEHKFQDKFPFLSFLLKNKDS